MTPKPNLLPSRTPLPGEVVLLRSRRWLVEETDSSRVAGEASVVRLACADDDAQGQTLDVYWEHEPDRLIVEQEGWPDLAARGFDSPRTFAAFLHTLRWNCVTATDSLLQQLTNLDVPCCYARDIFERAHIVGHVSIRKPLSHLKNGPWRTLTSVRVYEKRDRFPGGPP